MISLMRPQHARIIEGYFDGKELVISKSPLYDFTREEQALLRLFARNLFSRPIVQLHLLLPRSGYVLYHYVLQNRLHYQRNIFLHVAPFSPKSS